jgi:DNA-binding ferritin-like protein (Dps family)
MNAKQMITLNNERRKLLSDENLAAYENAMVYIRLNARSETITESVLLELLDHLIEAQQHGKNAQDVFGDDLHEYCDSLIANIPHQSKQSWVLDVLNYMTILLGSLFAVQTVVQLLSSFVPSLKVEQISMVPILLIVALGGIVILVLFYTLKSTVFGAKSWFILSGVTYILAIAIYVYSTFLFKDVWSVPINFWSSLALTAVMFALSRLFKQMSNKADQTPAN